MLRRRDSARESAIDQRAVGGHLSLSKRNSTPVGTLGLGVVGRLNSSSGSVSSSSSTSSSSGEHRRLDRCHSEPVKSGNSSRYKTELCRPFEEHGFCKYGDKCQFAHGSAELRTLSRHPKYKTELCRTFHTIGFCPYGPRCHFIHNAEERRGPTGSSPPMSSSSSSSSSPRQNLLTMGLGLETNGNGSCPNSGSDSMSPRSHTFPMGLGLDTHGANTHNSSPGPLSPRVLSMGLGLDGHGGGNQSSPVPMMGLGLGLGSTAESPSPPASLHGSPTGPSAFFDDAFTLFPGGRAARGLLEGLSAGLHGLACTTVSPPGSAPSPAAPSPGGSLPGLDTPPVSPVESLAGDLDSLSLSSSSHSTSPTPHALTHAHALEISRSLRLPIFEQLCEHD